MARRIKGPEEQLYEAVRKKDIVGVQQQLGQAEIDLNKTSSKDSSRTAFIRACFDGFTEGVELLSGDERVNLDLWDSTSQTGLIWAVQGQHIRAIEVLLKCKRLNVNLQDGIGATALWWVCRLGDEEALMYFIASGRQFDLSIATRSPNPYDIEAANTTAFAIATKKGHTNISEILIQWCNNPIHFTNTLRSKINNFSGFPIQEIKKDPSLTKMFRQIALEFQGRNFPFDVPVSISSMNELLAAIGKRLNIPDQNFEVSYFHPNLGQYMVLDNLVYLSEEVRHLRIQGAPPSWWDWEIEKNRGWQTSGSDEMQYDSLLIWDDKQGHHPILVEKFKFLCKSLGFSFDVVEKCYAIKNQKLNASFEHYLDILGSRHRESPAIFNSSSWREKADFQRRLVT